MASGSGKGGGGRNWVGTEHCRNMTHTRIFYGPQIWKKAGCAADNYDFIMSSCP